MLYFSKNLCALSSKQHNRHLFAHSWYYPCQEAEGKILVSASQNIFEHDGELQISPSASVWDFVCDV